MPIVKSRPILKLLARGGRCRLGRKRQANVEPGVLARRPELICCPQQPNLDLPFAGFNVAARTAVGRKIPSIRDASGGICLCASKPRRVGSLPGHKVRAECPEQVLLSAYPLAEGSRQRIIKYD